MAHSHSDSKKGLEREQYDDDLYKGRIFKHVHDAKDEVVQSTEDFPNGVPQTVFNYLNGDIPETKALSREQRELFTLLGGKLEDVLLPIATRAATLILGGEAKEVEEAIALVKAHPVILHSKDVVARDRLGRKVQGKLLQIAVMAGDVNLRDDKDIKEEYHGIVERLVSIEDGLSPEEVVKQLDEVITGTQAQHENELRNNRILSAVEKFGNDILHKASEYKKDKKDYSNFEDFQQFCQPCIDELEQALRFNPNEVIKSGYIFDLAILQKSVAWFEKKLSEFGGWWGIVSEVFWVNGYGKLQPKLSARDGHVMRHGVGYVAEQKEIPARTLNNDDGTSFFNSSSQCGRDLYLECCGPWFKPIRTPSGRQVHSRRPGDCAKWIRKFILIKNSSVAKLMQRSEQAKQNWCAVM